MECASDAVGVTDQSLGAVAALQGSAVLIGPCEAGNRMGGTGAIRKPPRR